jgi:hypothetical protein
MKMCVCVCVCVCVCARIAQQERSALPLCLHLPALFHLFSRQATRKSDILYTYSVVAFGFALKGGEGRCMYTHTHNEPDTHSMRRHLEVRVRGEGGERLLVVPCLLKGVLERSETKQTE